MVAAVFARHQGLLDTGGISCWGAVVSSNARSVHCGAEDCQACTDCRLQAKACMTCAQDLHCLHNSVQATLLLRMCQQIKHIGLTYAPTLFFIRYVPDILDVLQGCVPFSCN